MNHFPTCKWRWKVYEVMPSKEKRGLNWLKLYFKGTWLDRLFWGGWGETVSLGSVHFIYLFIYFLKMFFFFFIKFIYLFIFGCVGSSLLCTASGGYSLLQCVVFSLRWLLLLRSTGSRRAGFRRCGTQAQ